MHVYSCHLRIRLAIMSSRHVEYVLMLQSKSESGCNMRYRCRNGRVRAGLSKVS